MDVAYIIKIRKNFISMRRTQRKDLCTSPEPGHRNAHLCFKLKCKTPHFNRHFTLVNLGLSQLCWVGWFRTCVHGKESCLKGTRVLCNGASSLC